MKEEIVKRALEEFMHYGFKSFTMDDLAHKLGMSKKTLYELFPSKTDLVESTLDYVLQMTCKNIENFVQGEGSVIENVFRNERTVQTTFNIKSGRPIWELQKYYSKTYERMDKEFIEADCLFVDKVMERGIQEGLFREDINLKFFKIFYTAVQRMKAQSELFPETEFSFWETIDTMIEYCCRRLVNEKGLKELERVLKEVKDKR